MTHLSRQMREALIAAKRFNGLRRTWRHDTPGQPEWPANAASLAALVRRELMARREDRNRQGDRYVAWELTDAGRRALEPPTKVYVEPPVFLARASRSIGDYTSNPSRAMDRLEVGEPPSEHWLRAAKERHADSEDRRARARRLGNRRKAA